ncbi:hypothetical protein [Nocardioides sp. SYSU D00038]|uniref:hypothetical protein n=1 Tax=Nocardioides sp. SYSU D00038 TaxID=2812554 RepID=UPI001967EEE3|nr:hypothetical protein [Nocardioides sp. SYSU D00038]
MEPSSLLLVHAVAWHLGPMHAYERALTLLLAFGPFVVLGLVVAWRRRQDRAEERRDRVVAEEREPRG